MKSLFNSRDIAYRDPFGAVAEGTAIHFRVRVPRELRCRAVWLRVEEDACASTQFGTFWAGMADADTEWWECHYVPTHAALYWYDFLLDVADGRRRLRCRGDGSAELCAEDVPPRPWQLTCYAADFRTPTWLLGGVMYQIFPDRFCASGASKAGVPTDREMHASWEDVPVWKPDAQGRVRNADFFGGDLQGIRRKLEYLQSLGVTCLYLNPIFEAHSNHRYDTADYRAIDPLLGTEEDLRLLAKEAKQRGMRLLLDGVFSHTGSDSRYFNKERRYGDVGAYNSPTSPYRSWYRFYHFPNDYAAWWGMDTLPEVNECDPSFKEFILGENGVVPYWLRQGASGWRLDVADELPDEFLDALRTTAKAVDPDALILGEVWEDASNKESYGHRRRYLLGGQLDSVMNYPFRDAILGFLLGGSATDFHNAVMTIAERYPPPVLHLLMNHIGTHDTERALTVLGGEAANGRGREWQAGTRLSAEQRERGLRRLRVAALLQYCLVGVPCVYYGDEAGMEGYRDPFNRCGYPWGREETELIEWYRRLGKLRASVPMLRDGELRPFPTGTESVVAFTRRSEEGTLLCLVNREEKEVEVALPDEWNGATLLLGEGKNEWGLRLSGIAGAVLIR